MKSYTITVNGNVYDVTVEENGAATPAAAAAPRKAAPAPKAPAAAPKAAGKCWTKSFQRRYSNHSGSNEDGNSGCSSGRWNSCKY